MNSKAIICIVTSKPLKILIRRLERKEKIKNGQVTANKVVIYSTDVV